MILAQLPGEKTPDGLFVVGGFFVNIALFSSQQNTGDDNSLLILVTLWSSVLIYNTMEVTNSHSWRKNTRWSFCCWWFLCEHCTFFISAKHRRRQQLVDTGHLVVQCAHLQHHGGDQLSRCHATKVSFSETYNFCNC